MVQVQIVKKKSITKRAALILLALLFACTALVFPSVEALGDKCKDQGKFVKNPTAGAMFNDPAGGKAKQYRLVREFNDNVHGAKPGSDIRVVTLAITVADSADAMLHAYRCGVNVKVVVPRAQWDQHQVQRLRRVLGEDISKQSFVASCSRSCFFADGGRTMHAKMFLFSQTNRATDVTMFTSTNLDQLQPERAYNDAYQIIGNQQVYEASAQYFDVMKHDTDNTYKNVFKLTNYWLYFFPDRKSKPGHDYHSSTLSNIKCKTSKGRTLIEQNIAIANRKDIAKRLVALYKQGCDVRVNVHLDRTSKAIKKILFEGGVPTHVRSRAQGDLSVHSKSVIISGKQYNKFVKTVYTGSTNLTNDSTIGDNNNIRIVNNAAAWQAFHDNFQKIWAGGRPLKKDDVVHAKTIDFAKAELED